MRCVIAVLLAFSLAGCGAYGSRQKAREAMMLLPAIDEDEAQEESARGRS